LCHGTSRLISRLDPREIEAMKNAPGKDMLLFGSASIVAELTRHGLIDEYMFVLTPLLLGDGKPMLHGVSNSCKLDLLQVKPYPSGNVMLRYARSRQ
jgi:dihydrofolate reductase